MAFVSEISLDEDSFFPICLGLFLFPDRIKRLCSMLMAVPISALMAFDSVSSDSLRMCCVGFLVRCHCLSMSVLASSYILHALPYSQLISARCAFGASFTTTPTMWFIPDMCIHNIVASLQMSLSWPVSSHFPSVIQWESCCSSLSPLLWSFMFYTSCWCSMKHFLWVCWDRRLVDLCSFLPAFIALRQTPPLCAFFISPVILILICRNLIFCNIWWLTLRNPI